MASDRDFTATLAAGMSILSAFREGDSLLAHRELVARTGLAKAQASRLAFTLTTLGFLRRDAATGRYRLGSAVLSMGYPLLAGMRIRQIARPYMRDMADEVGGAVSMGLRDRAQMIYVESSRSDAASQDHADIGTALPLLESAMGLAWLAAAPPQDSERALNQALVASGRQADASARRPVRQAARQCASQGFVEGPDTADGLRRVALALSAPVDGDTLVLDCAAPRRSTGANELGERLVLMVRAIEGAMALR